ncbi:cleft lip and palate transmembrane protein 1-domain-containing protein [Chlamydoabsidia padenii]|nr:cleft lip and palate transmembrane protein 1-domain-containing protein [Chlamydoabsidia padenii]
MKNKLSLYKQRSMFTWLHTHYKYIVLLSGCILTLLFYNGEHLTTLPRPSTTQHATPSLTMPLTKQPTTMPTRMPEGVYHNPFPLQTPMNDLPEALVGLWHKGLSMDLLVYIDQNEYFTDYHRAPSCHIRHLILGDFFESQMQQIKIPLDTQAWQPNAILYAHIFLTRANATIHPGHTGFNPEHIVYKRHVLTKYYPTKHAPSSFFMLLQSLYRNSLSTMISTPPELDQETPTHSLVSYWQEKVTISLVINDGKEVIPKTALQPATLKYIPLETTLATNEKMAHTVHPLLAGGESGHRIGFYRPIIFPNDFWLLQQHAYPVDENTTHLPLTIQVEPIDMWKFNTLAVFEDASSNPFGGMTMIEMDQVKLLLLETNSIWLCLLLLLCVFYCLFSWLAFQNDILFWKNKTSDNGVSLFGMNLQLMGHIILVLNMVNSQRTSGPSVLLLLTRCFSVIIQAWKINKILPSYRPFWIQHSKHHPPNATLHSTEKDNTKEGLIRSNKQRWQWIRWNNIQVQSIGILGVCIACHWYARSRGEDSLTLQCLSETVYMLDFLFLLPQAIKNHRLKKVEHISRRTLLYKSLNILIDTVFAIAIKVNFIHCLACIQQDILYLFIFYQCYIYSSSSSSSSSSNITQLVHTT